MIVAGGTGPNDYVLQRGSTMIGRIIGRSSRRRRPWIISATQFVHSLSVPTP
jgi:hypothetical protein